MPRESPVTTHPDTTDLFGRQPVALPYTLVDAQMHYDLLPEIFDTQLTSGGTCAIDGHTGSALLSVTSTVGSKVIRQTRLFAPYEPGMMQKAEVTGTLAADATYTRSRYGYFSDENGVFLERGPDGEFVVSRSKISGSVVDTKIPRADWNGYISPDCDLTLSQIFVTRLQFLGVGTVETFFNRNSVPTELHAFYNDNVRETAYWTTASLPVRYEIETVAAGGSGAHMRQICCSVKSEGGFDPEKGLSFAATSPERTVTTLRPLLSVRPKLLCAGQVNRIPIRPYEISALVSGDPAELVVIQGGTLTGATWLSDFGSAGRSCVEADTAATAVTGGVVTDRDLAPTASKTVSAYTRSDLRNRRWITLNIAGDTADLITVAALTRGASSDVIAKIGWLEVR